MLNREETIRSFRESILPLVRDEYEQDCVPDYPARSEAWNNFLDDLVRCRKVPRKAEGWQPPMLCFAPWER